jgi:hypothetical protein
VSRWEYLLPVPIHVVFTLPTAVAEIAFQNKRVVYHEWSGSWRREGGARPEPVLRLVPPHCFAAAALAIPEDGGVAGKYAFVQPDCCSAPKNTTCIREGPSRSMI